MEIESIMAGYLVFAGGYLIYYGVRLFFLRKDSPLSAHFAGGGGHVDFNVRREIEFDRDMEKVKGAQERIDAHNVAETASDFKATQLEVQEVRNMKQLLQAMVKAIRSNNYEVAIREGETLNLELNKSGRINVDVYEHIQERLKLIEKELNFENNEIKLQRMRKRLKGKANVSRDKLATMLSSENAEFNRFIVEAKKDLHELENSHHEDEKHRQEVIHTLNIIMGILQKSINGHSSETLNDMRRQLDDECNQLNIELDRLISTLERREEILRKEFNAEKLMKQLDAKILEQLKEEEHQDEQEYRRAA